jgi:hypothetical protein
MGMPDESPCSCEACHGTALEPNAYCIECESEQCKHGGPSCSSVESNPNWCDICEERKETEKFHGKHLCKDCKLFEPVRRSDLEHLDCYWCGEDVNPPFVFSNGDTFEDIHGLTLEDVEEMGAVYHEDCLIEEEKLNKREENNHDLGEF